MTVLFLGADGFFFPILEYNSILEFLFTFKNEWE